MTLSASNITVKANGVALLDGADLALNPGELVAILGPNGAGKTTLIRTALGFIKPASGQVLIGGDDAQSLKASDRARRLAYLPQTRPLAWPNRVRDIVALGRYAHGATLGRLTGEDAAAVDAAIAACDIAHLAGRSADTLSGGELARVHCARAFAARAPMLIADEPVAALDPRHQYRVMGLIRDYVDAGSNVAPRASLVVLHDVSLAAKFADRLMFMKAGKVIADGPPAKVLTAERLADVYGVNARIDGSDVIIDGIV